MSKILVNEIAPRTSGGTITSPFSTSNIIESFQHICDGSTITLPSGEVTLPNITSAPGTIGTTWVDLASSKITYTPPEGTKYVHYKHYYHARWNGSNSHKISHQKIFIDGAEVVYARNSIGGSYNEGMLSTEWVFPIGGTADANTGRLASWTSAKEIKMQVRDYNVGSYLMNYHITQYWDGGGTGQFVMPLLAITAYS